ncbi:hypothetical protein YC2023_002473 [Brassica napus]
MAPRALGGKNGDCQILIRRRRISPNVYLPWKEDYVHFLTAVEDGKSAKDSDWKRDEKYDQHQQLKQKENVWSRLKNNTLRRKTGDYKPHHESRNQIHGTQGRLQRHESYEARHRKSNQVSQHSQQSNDQSRAVTHSKHMGDSPSEKADSQQTISGVIPDRTGHNGQGNGALMVHQNKTVDERMRRLKRK